jgi:ribonuclease J
MRVRIHRGTQEIGGTCIELEASGSRIVLDLGLPLSAESPEACPLPSVEGLIEPNGSLLAIVLSHGHRDHWGLIPRALPTIPIIMGRATEQIMRAAASFVPKTVAIPASKYLESGRQLGVGPFKIRPHLVDHSAFDAYALEVEADGKKLFYSGDLRAHGRKGRLFEALIQNPPKDVDLMLMEGSSLGRLRDDGTFPTEDDVEQLFLDKFVKTPGMALVACSAQNIDRVVSVYRAAKRAGRTLVIDAYAAEILNATGHRSIPKVDPSWSNLAVYIPQHQRVQLVRNGIASIVESYKGFRLWSHELKSQAPRLVMLFRAWMLKDLEDNDALVGAAVYWSQWEGYLNDAAGAKLKRGCDSKQIQFETIHTSGHASPVDLKRLASAVAPKRLVPIHTFAGHRYPELFDNVQIVNDGQWVDL